MQSLIEDRRVEATAPRSVHLAYADALRAAAILLVVLQHVIIHTQPLARRGHPLLFAYLGVLGVNCFFVLSGYLLARPYVAALLDPARPQPSARLFYTRRFLRIWPLYAVALALGVAANAAFEHVPPSGADVAMHLLMLHTLDRRFATSIDGPLWTMSVDVWFYALLPPLAAIAARCLRGRSARTRERALFASLAAVFAGSIAWHYAALSAHPAAVSDFATALVDVRNVVGFAGTFALGAALAAVALLYRDRLPRRPALFAGIVAAGGAFAVVPLVLPAYAGTAPATHAQLAWASVNDAMGALAAGLVFFGLSEGRLPPLTRITRAPAVTAVAALAYAVYLVHWPILEALVAVFHAPTGPRAFAGIGALALAATTAVAYAMHVLVERPILRIKDGLREGEPAPAAVRAVPAEASPAP